MQVTIVLRDVDAKRTDTAHHIYTYNSIIVPSVGEFIEICGHKPYEVERVIHVVSNGNSSVIVEVKNP